MRTQALDKQIVLIDRDARTGAEIARYLESVGYEVTLAKRPAAHAVGKNPHAAALGRLGGLKGGHARAARLSPRKRKMIARKAARARWARRVA